MRVALEQIIDQLVAGYDPERILLFGSRARGEADEISDVDLVVIKCTNAPFFDRLREVARLLPVGAGGVDVLVYTPDEFERMQQEGNAFAETIAVEGQELYAREATS